MKNMGKKTQLKPDEVEEGSILEDAKGSKKSKKSKKKDYDEEDIAKELEELTLEVNGVAPKEKQKNENETQENSKKLKKATKKGGENEGSDADEAIQPTIGGGFAALMGDDDDGDDNDDNDNDEEEKPSAVKQKNKNKEVPAKQEKSKKDKAKKGKNKRKGNDEDEDIDELLAELEAEYKGVKYEKKQVKNKEKQEDDSKLDDEKSSIKTEQEDKEEDDKKQIKVNKEKSQNEAPIEDKPKVVGKLTKNEISGHKERQTKKEPSPKLEETIPQSKGKPTEKERQDTSVESKKSDKEVKANGKAEKEVKGNEKKETKVKEPKQSEKVSSKKGKEQEKLAQDSKKKDKKVEKEESPPLEEQDVEEASKKKKSKAKTKEDKKKEVDDVKGKKGKPNQKMIEAMRQLLAKQKEEEERLKKEEEERQRQEEERILQLEELRRLEEEKKERQKQKQKERMKRLKDEGKLLTPKQKLEQRRAQAMLEHLKAQGVTIPEVGEKLPITPVSYKRQRRKKQDEAKDEIQEEKPEEAEEEEVEEEKKEEEETKEVEDEEEDVVDDWDQMSESGDEEQQSEANDKKGNSEAVKKSESNLDTDQKEQADSDSESEEERQTEAEKRRERAIQRMATRKIANEKKKSETRLRSPVVCVLGHVDHGKTKILDKLRRTNVQEGEVGGITQQIGATNVPFDAVKSQTRMVKDFDVDSIRLPGLLIIDTPGHESFSNLRTRGSSLCDIAILVVDITQGLEPQTIESINLLKTKKTPFVVALNKVDRVFEWDSNPSKDIREIIKLQNEPCKNDFERRTKEVIQALNNQGLNAALFWENPDPRSYVSLIPTSAISGDGMGNLISLITTMCQKRLTSRLMFSEELQCTVLEVKTIQGHGTTIDVILVNGRLKEGDTVILAGTEGPIVTQIRSLLIPKPMKEIRVKGQYDELKVVEAALGVKVAARDLDKAIAGLNLQVAHHEDEVDLLKEEVDREFKNAMRSIKVRDKGVYVQASTLGALEALLEFFKVNKVPYAGIRVGPVVKRDVMKAAAMLEHDPMYAVILAFDVKVERDAQELADKEGIKIFSEETIYHLGDRYVDYIKEYKKKKQDEFRHVAVFPCKLKIIPDAIFNKRDPIVLGVTVDHGILRTGTPLCVPSKEFVDIGVVTSLEFDHKVVEIAKKGVNVCMKVEPLPGHTPKLFGRHFDVEDVLISKITRESIDACKQYFRDDMGKTEWKLMADLKKQFNIL